MLQYNIKIIHIVVSYPETKITFMCECGTCCLNLKGKAWIETV